MANSLQYGIWFLGELYNSYIGSDIQLTQMFFLGWVYSDRTVLSLLKETRKKGSVVYTSKRPHDSGFLDIGEISYFLDIL